MSCFYWDFHKLYLLGLLGVVFIATLMSCIYWDFYELHQWIMTVWNGSLVLFFSLYDRLFNF